MDAKDADFAELLAAKDQEVQDTQEMLNSRWEEFSGQYEKLSELVQQRNDLIQAKEVELSHKDSEITQLKTQLDEMRDQTRDMVADLQRQLTSTKAAAERLWLSLLP
jgi:chromosome segregation ATPase